MVPDVCPQIFAAITAQMLINFPAEANNGEQASCATEVTRQLSGVEQKLSQEMFGSAAVERHRALTNL